MPDRPHVRVAAIQPRGYPFDPAAAIDHWGTSRAASSTLT